MEPTQWKRPVGALLALSLAAGTVLDPPTSPEQWLLRPGALGITAIVAAPAVEEWVPRVH